MTTRTEEHELFEEAYNLLCGSLLGTGMTRKVYECALLPGYAVKVENVNGWFQNVLEWQTWNRVKDTKASRWFAECRWISPNGKVLIQERTIPAPATVFPGKVPVWFTDLKRSNWGLVTAKRGGPAKEFLVCHDYGTSLVLQEGTSTSRLKKADWYDES